LLRDLSFASVSTVTVTALSAFSRLAFLCSASLASFGKLDYDIVTSDASSMPSESRLSVLWVLKLYKGVSALESKFADCSELLELVGKVVLTSVPAQLTNVKLSLTVSSCWISLST